MLKNRQLYQTSLKKSVDWLLTQINPDGTVNPTSKGAIGFYKLPWALILAGRHVEAKRIIAWTVRETLAPDGDLKSDKRQKFHLDYYTYPNAWICVASHLLSLFDISYPTWDYIQSHQDPQTGGYCSRGPHDPRKDNLQDAISTAFSSLVGLHLGKIEEAKKAARFLQTLLELQPNFKEEFYYYCSPQKGLVTEKPEEEPDERFVRVSMKDKEETFYFILGATIAFLATLSVATKDKQYLDLAKAYSDFVVRADEHALGTESCGKLSYGHTLLYQASGEEKYLQLAEKFMKSLLEIGEPGGFWIRGGKPTASSTAEFIIWLYSLLIVGDRDGRS